MKVLVVGATGLLGEAVTRHLSAGGFEVRVLARSVEKARQMFGDSLEIVPGDATDAAAVDKALAGCEGVHISIGGPDEAAGVAVITKAAVKHNLKRISYISGTTVREENGWFSLINMKLQGEKVIRESGIPYTIFCPTWFMGMLSNFVRGGRTSMLGDNPTPYHFLSVDDLGRMVTTAYQIEEAANKRLYIHGPEAFTIRQALERYCAALEPSVTSVSAMPLWLARLMAMLTGNEDMKYGTALMAYFIKLGAEPGDPTEANTLLGAPTITLDAWLAAQQAK